MRRVDLKNKIQYTLLGVALFVQCQLTVWSDVTVNPQQLSDSVRSHMMQQVQLEDKTAALHVDMLRIPSAPLVLKGNTLHISASNSQTALFNARTVIQLLISTEQETRHLGIPVHITVEKPVWVAKKWIPARSNIKPADVALEKRHLEYGFATALSASDNLANYTSRINLMPGSIVDARNVKQTPMVFQNDEIHVVLAMSNGVNVSVLGKALESGAKGDRIRVRSSLASNKPRIYTGEITGRSLVTVNL